MAYEYITDNNLYEKQHYMYSEYRGVDFLKDYLDSRYKYIDSRKIWGGISSYTESLDDLVQNDFMGILQKLKDGDYSRETIDTMNAYTKSFEVRKRIYLCYDSHWKPVEGTGFENYYSYLLFADCLLHMYQHTGCLKYFSCLLKVDDSLLSVQSRLPENLQGYFSQLISRELDVFFQLARENGLDEEVTG